MAPTKVDSQSRRRYAEVLRHFAAGHLTNREYEDASNPLRSSGDRGIAEVYFAVWFTYDDLKTHRLAGAHRLTDESRRKIARSIVFLHSDLPMEWPRVRLLLGLLNLLSFGLFRRWFPLAPSGGDTTAWPFFREGDLRAAAARPRLLGGARSSTST